MKTGAVFLLVLLTECQPERHERASSAPASVAARADAAEELDRLDRRKPVPLLPMMANHQKQNMREHLEVVQEVVAATAARDFAKAAVAAQRIGYSEAMGRMCEHMGAGAPGFTDQALAFHHSADRIVEAAHREDSAAVLAALSETLATCTGCHATYKQKVVVRLDE